MESTQENTTMPADLSNTARLYYAMDTTMMLAHREDTDEADEKAVTTARVLVEDADVPLYIRARACMVLGCSEEHDFIVWAEEGVRVGNLIMEIVGENATDVERTLLKNCKEVLEEAKKEKAAREAEALEEGEVEGEVEREVEGAVAAAGDGENVSVGGEKVEAGETSAEKMQGKKTNVPRTITDPKKTLDPSRVQDPPEPPRKPKQQGQYDGADDDGDEKMGSEEEQSKAERDDAGEGDGDAMEE